MNMLKYDHHIQIVPRYTVKFILLLVFYNSTSSCLPTSTLRLDAVNQLILIYMRISESISLLPQPKFSEDCDSKYSLSYVNSTCNLIESLHNSRGI